MSPKRSKSNSPEIVENNAVDANPRTMLGEERRVQPRINHEINIIDEGFDLPLAQSPFEQESEQFQPWSDTEDFQTPVVEANDSTHTERVRLLQESRERQQRDFQVGDLSDHTLVVGPRVGAGSYGRVYLGDHVSHGEVAVKIVHANDSKALTSVLREICASMAMGEHQNVATVFETRICQCPNPFHVGVGGDTPPGTSTLAQGAPLQRQRRHAWAGSTDSLSRYVVDCMNTGNRMRVTVFSRDPESSMELQHFLSSLDASRAVDTDELYFAIIGEFCNGGTLYEMLRKGDLKHNDVETKYAYLKAIVLGAASGVQHMHHKDMVHRDLSNTNIMLHYTRMFEDGKPNAESLTTKLIDFGRASVNAMKTMQTNSLSTVSYSAPEFMMRGHSSKASDIYSLGVLIWEVWTGCCAWAGARDVQVVYAVTSGKTLDIPEDMPCDLMMLMHSCMSFDPKDRPEIDEVVQQLESMTDMKNPDTNSKPDQ